MVVWGGTVLLYNISPFLRSMSVFGFNSLTVDERICGALGEYFAFITSIIWRTF